MKAKLPLRILIGNLFEHYDTALFGLLTPFLSPLFFPHHDPLTALAYTYGMIPLAMIAKPFGAFFFGRIGDRSGRDRMLFLTLFGMGITSLLIGCLPTYASCGLWAALLLILLRLSQNFFASGETVGGGIALLESSSESYHDIVSSLYSCSTIAGILLASSAVTVISYYTDVKETWRLLFVIGATTALVGSYFRQKGVSQPGQSSQFSLAILGAHWRSLLKIGIIAGFSYACYSLSLVLLNGFAPLVSNVTKEEMVLLNSWLILLDMLLLPLFGTVAKWLGREKSMGLAAMSCMATGLFIFPLIEGADYVTVTLIRISLVTMGVWFSASFHSWSLHHVPKEVRATVISTGYALGSQLIGAPLAVVSLYLYKATGNVESVSLYWVLLAGLAAFVIRNREEKPCKLSLA